MTTPTPKDRASYLLSCAKKHGATHAESLYAGGRGTSLSFLNGKMDAFDVADESAIGLRALIGRKQAVAVTSDLSDHALDTLAERVCAMAKAATEDPDVTVATAEQFAKGHIEIAKSLDMADENTPTADMLKDWTATLEGAALNAKGISKSGGASSSFNRGQIFLMTSSGFEGGYSKTGYGLSVTVLSGDSMNMVRDYAYSSARHQDDLRPIADIAREAAERTLAKHGAKPMGLGAVPVLFDRRVAASLLGHFAGAINGDNVVRGTSFLHDKKEAAVFGEHIRITDNPLMVRGLASRPFDAEGLPTAELELVSGGVLKNWLLDLESAKRLSLHPTGNASRGTGSLPGPSTTNMLLHAGEQSPADMIKDIERGFFVTSLIGHGVNGITGDYSRGAEGFLIENGQISSPLQEVTIAGNLINMFAKLTPANDIVFDRSIVSPTVRIDGMTVAGQNR
jgi:PmbA protein